KRSRRTATHSPLAPLPLNFTHRPKPVPSPQCLHDWEVMEGHASSPESLPREDFMRETWLRLRQHLITGFLFIMPVLITLAVLGRFWKDMLRIGGVCSRLLRVDTILGP